MKHNLLKIALGTLCATPVVATATTYLVEQFRVTFENDSWENVCKYANMGLDALKEHYHLTSFVGRRKTFYFKIRETNYKHTAIVIDENKDVTPDGNKTALTLQMKNVISGDNLLRIWLVTAQNNATCWRNSNIRKGLLEVTEKGMPKVIYDNVKTVLKKSFTIDGKDVLDFEETFFIPSLNEIYSNELIKNVWYPEPGIGLLQKPIKDVEKYALEGEQYAYYKDIAKYETGIAQENLIKKTIYIPNEGEEVNTNTWLRTKVYGSSKYDDVDNPLSYYFITNEGKLQVTIANGRQPGTLSPIFCI